MERFRTLLISLFGKKGRRRLTFSAKEDVHRCVPLSLSFLNFSFFLFFLPFQCVKLSSFATKMRLLDLLFSSSTENTNSPGSNGFFSGYSSSDSEDDEDFQNNIHSPERQPAEINDEVTPNVTDSVVVNYDRLLGSGAHGAVYESHLNKKRTAFKILKEGPYTQKRFERERTTMTEFQSESTIVNLLGLVDPFGLVIDYMQNGDLSVFLEKNRFDLSFERLLKIASGISSGLNVLHSNGYVHGDLCPENILVNDELCPILCDFGLTRPPTEDSRCFGNPIYSAPEGFFGKFYSEKSDIFSFGMILHDIFFPPSLHSVAPKRFISTKKSLLTKKNPSLLDLFFFPENSNTVLRSVISSCLNSEPSRRPSCLQISQAILSQFSLPGG